MKAVVQDRYGPPDDVLKLREIDIPAIGDDQVLVRVRATSVHPDVWHDVTGLPYLMRLGNGLRRPKERIQGSDLAGQVESIGKNVTRFQAGDEVFGWSSTQLFGHGGTFAEYAAVSQDVLALKPPNVTFEQAAAVPTSGYFAVVCLRLGGELKGRHVLLNGAGGCLGSIAIQMAKAEGARVTGVDCAEKLAMIRALGADDVIDYAREDFLQRSERYDFVLDITSTRKFKDCKRVLTPTGLFWHSGHGQYGESGRILGSTFPHDASFFVGFLFDRHVPRFRFKFPSKQDTMAVLKGLLESGKLAPIIGRTFPLSEVPAAIRCLKEGRTPGRIMITP